jgi:hypothetical protein
MSDKTRFEYRLPRSCVHAVGSITYKHDSILDDHPDQVHASPETTLSLGVAPDSTQRVVDVSRGVLRDIEASFEVTEDRMLVSSSAESTGQAGKLITGVTGLAAAAAGVVAGLPSGALLGAIAAAGVSKSEIADGAQGFQRLDEAVRERDLTDEEKVALRYALKNRDVARRRADFEHHAKELAKRICEVTEELVGSGDPVEIAKLDYRLRALERTSSIVNHELDKLNVHFKAWRDGTISTRTEARELSIDADAIRAADARIDAGVLRLASGGAAQGAVDQMSEMWKSLGVAARIDHLDGGPEVPAPSTGSNQIVVRIPRPARLTVFKKMNGKAFVTDSRGCLVMDSSCKHEVITFRKSFFAKRHQAAKFSTGGALTSLSYGSTSSAGAIADTLGGLPGTVSDALEHSQKIIDQAAALRRAPLEHRLTEAKDEADLKQQEITKAGLLATEEDYAELERLKQQADILAQRKAIADATATPDAGAAELAGMKQQIEVLNAKRELAVANRELEAETELGGLRLEIERLKAKAASNGG